MAEEKKDEKKEEAKPAADAPAPDAEVQKAGGKKKLIVIAGIGTVALAALGGGGFFAFKTFMGKKDVKLEAKVTDEKGEEKKDEHKDDKSAEGKDEKKDEKKDGAKDDKSAEHKDEKKDAPADAKKDEHGGDKNADEGKKEEKKDEAAKDGKDAKDGKAAPAEPGKDGAKKEGDKGDPNAVATYDVPRMDLNLGNPLENRFLRMGIAIEYRGGEAQLAEIKRREPQIKDILITTVGQKSRMEILTDTGKQRLRRELLNKINEIVEQPVSAIYYTEFMVE